MASNKYAEAQANLKKISSYAKLKKKPNGESVSIGLIHLLRSQGKIEFVKIDGVFFVDIIAYPPNPKKRK